MQGLDTRSDRIALTALVIGGILAGGNAVGVRFTVLELDALWGAGLRFAAASLLFAALMAVRRLPLPRGRDLRGAALFGLLGVGGAYAFAYYALSHMQAGLASPLIALVPLATLGLAVSQRQESMRLSGVGGGVIAVAGVVLVSKVSLDGAVPPLALAAGFASVLCMAQAAVVGRKLRQLHPIVLNTVSMASGAAILLAGAVIVGDEIVLPRQGATWLAVGYLVVGGSMGMFTAYLLVLRHWEASRASYLTLLMPPVAMALSAWLDSEPITGALVVGAMLTLAGVYVGAVRPAMRPVVSSAAATPPTTGTDPWPSTPTSGTTSVPATSAP